MKPRFRNMPPGDRQIESFWPFPLVRDWQIKLRSWLRAPADRQTETGSAVRHHPSFQINIRSPPKPLRKRPIKLHSSLRPLAPRQTTTSFAVRDQPERQKRCLIPIMAARLLPRERSRSPRRSLLRHRPQRPSRLQPFSTVSSCQGHEDLHAS